MKVIVFTLENCPNCEKLKQTLKDNKIWFEEWNLEDKKSLFELRYHSCFPQEAPVLIINCKAYESKEIFSNGEVNPDILTMLKSEAFYD